MHLAEGRHLDAHALEGAVVAAADAEDEPLAVTGLHRRAEGGDRPRVAGVGIDEPGADLDPRGAGGDAREDDVGPT